MGQFIIMIKNVVESIFDIEKDQTINNNYVIINC